MRATAGVRDFVKTPERFASAALELWMLAAGSITYFVPLLAFLVLRPGFLTAALALVWVVAVWAFLATLGVALVAGGRSRGIGAAVILGQALGLVLLAVSVFWALQHTHIAN